MSELVDAPEESMLSFTVYVRREGRITIPKELRDAFDINEGDLIECQIKKIRRF